MKNITQRILHFLLQAQLGRSIEVVSRYRVAKAFYQIQVYARQIASDALLGGIGVVVAGLGLKSFLLPSHFIDGGVTGISLLVSATTGLPLSLLIVLINIPFVLLAYKQIGPSFAIKSMLAIAGLAIAVVAIPYPVITTDKLLIATFGGFFLGSGIGLAIRGGAVLDGTEVLAIYVSRRTSLSVGDVILLFNIVIFSVAAYLLGYETAMYAVLTYLAASKTVDFIIEGVEEYVGVTIISSHYDEVCQFIVLELNAGVTAYAGHRGHGKRGVSSQSEIIYTVVTRLEIARLQHGVERIDPNAFIVMGNVRGVRGGSIRKRAGDFH
jgi:uncharacterized membrane-anchored protein YitT (DUF2179 family)